MPAKKCGTCRYYQESTLSRLGWCRNPRLHDERDRSLVGVNELPCDKSFYDFWEPRVKPAPPEGAKQSGTVGKLGKPVALVAYSLVGVAVVAMMVMGATVALHAPTPSTPTTVVEAVLPTPTATEVPTPTPPPPTYVRVGNTDGDGVYIRPQPSKLAKGIIAHPDNTRLQVIGDDVQAEGQVWKKVRDDKGNEGWVPARYVIPEKN